MKTLRFIRCVRDAIKDPEREFSERLFLIMTIISEITALIALAGDILTGECLGEILFLAGVTIAVPLITFTCLYCNKIKFAIYLIVTGLVVVIIPVLFFVGGGVRGGGVLWIIFAFLYVGLVISGTSRKVMLVLIFLESLGCYLAEYYHPDWVTDHSRRVFYVDSFLSIILVGVVCFVMGYAQNLLFIAENKRARKEAERAEELTRAQNRFFSSMSHEIRTPINSILGLNELILRDKDASEEIVRDASGIQGAGKLLLALINDILDFSKMEAESMEIVPVDYHVGEMLSELVNMIWLKALDKGLKFDVSIDPAVPAVLYGDEVRIKQIIINLLNNAVKYTAEGSVSLHIESKEADEKTTVLTISISDTGIGIKKEAIPYLFDAFKRVDEEKNRHIEGTGLGLSIVKQLIELMDGTVTVNSVYGEGSTFTVTLKQGISDPTQIGEMCIHNQQMAKKSRYESSFKAPDAKILIVDDNEMNLEVERKLLADTGLYIDTVTDGREALELTLKIRYDVILMDHLMPEMDGIECLEQVRSQTGGLNRTTPVVVLTANAGSDNRNLYNRSGFDGYLVKPVSGAMLEETLMKYIPKEKMIISSKMLRMREDINTAARYARKAPVLITSTSMSDLPDYVIRKLNIPILPFLIRTEEGIFQDGVQMDSNELIRYINKGKNAKSSPPDVRTFTEFFAATLKKAHHVIHISLTSGMSEEYRIATEAAKSFDNVTVINSGCLSSATGILVLIAYRLAQQSIPVDEIVREIETVKQSLRCSFVIDTTEYMVKKGLVGERIGKIARTLNLHPSLRVRNDRSGIGNIWAGKTRRAYRKYIRAAFPVDIIPDPDVVFITYADVPLETLLWIKEEISRITHFENVVFKQASAAISSNCGPGSFGILYFAKSNKSYNIGAFVETKEKSEMKKEATGGRKGRLQETKASVLLQSEETETENAKERRWYQTIEKIDGDIALENSGSEHILKDVMKIFYDAARTKSAELEGFFTAEDWENYTIRIHALKSSARLIGAIELSEAAQLLENAGKEKNIGYIRKEHPLFMEEYHKLTERLEELFEQEEQEKQEDEPQTKTAVEQNVLDAIYGKFKTAAEAMDCDVLEEAVFELMDLSIPEEQKELVNALMDKAEQFDYQGILDLLKKE